MPGKQHKRLKTISWLMLASQVMLLLFVAEWMRSQYRQEAKRLDEDLRNLFARTEERLTNDSLDRTVAIMLNDSHMKGMHGQMEVNFGDDSTAVYPIHSFDTTARSRHKLSMPMPGKTWPEGTTAQVKTIKIRRKSDTPLLPEAVLKILRVTVQQAVSNGNFLSSGSPITVDSGKLRRQFMVELKKKQLPFAGHWDNAPGKAGRMFAYSQTDGNSPAAMVITGYRPHLVRALLPQAGFSAVLLLLTGLAFWLAYRNMQRQARFGEQKDGFISNISHELKTPVATTKVALEALSTYNAIDDPVRSRKYLEMARWEMTRLEALINRVMNTVMAEHGRISLDKEPLNLAALLREITSMLQPLLTGRILHFDWPGVAEQITVDADKMHLQGAIYNLLDNAVKYGGTDIYITLGEQDGKAILRISDNGPGIPAEYRNKVFDNFFRVPYGDRHDVKGHGLGLSYARYAVQAHNGSLTLEHNTGTGATFILTLPLSNHRHEP